MLYFHANHIQKQNESRFTTAIERNLEQELISIEQTYQQIRKKVATEQTSFDQLLIPANYPYFIYRNNLLSFWSDNKWIPNVRDLTGDYEIKLLERSNSFYLIRKHVLQGNRTLYFTIPLVKRPPIFNAYLKPAYNSNLFDNINFEITGALQKDGHAVRYNELELFHIKYGSSYKLVRSSTRWVVYLLASGTFLFFGLFLGKLANRWQHRGKYEAVGLLFLLSLGLVRVAMIIFDFPFSYFPSDLFNPRYYASSSINPSLGDMLLNIVVLMLVSGYVFRNYHKMHFVKELLMLSKSAKRVAITISFLYGHLLLSFVFLIITSLNKHSQWNLDISQELSFGLIKVISLLVILLTAVIYFFHNHVVVRLSFKLAEDRQYELILAYVVSSVIFIGLAIIDNWDFYPIILINLLFYLILYLFNLPSKLYRIQFLTFMYFFISSLPVAAVGAYAIYKWHHKNLRSDKERLAGQLLVENDMLTEFMLQEMSGRISGDVYIQSRIFNPYVSKDGIKQKIRSVYLNSYLEKYQVDIYLFNSAGFSIDREKKFDHIEDVREVDGIRNIDDGTYFAPQYGEYASKRYLKIIELERYDRVSGYVLLDLKMRKVVPNTVYPMLLVDNRYSSSSLGGEFSYGILSQDNLLYSLGSFSYDNQDFIRQARQHAFDENGWKSGDQIHFAIRGEENKWVLISFDKYPFQHVVSNFSFIYLIELIGILSYLIFVTVYFRLRKIEQNYATRIQLYLSVAFFVPLIIVSVSAVSLLVNSYEEDLENKNVSRAKTISNQISPYLERFFQNELSQNALFEKVSEIARYAELDINVFNVNGRLLATSQPPIYENDLLSDNINPVAMVSMERGRLNGTIITEQIGELAYKNIYAGVKSFESGQLLGIVSLPFFDSKADLERNVISVLTNVMNIFTIIFLLFLLVSFLASRWLTFPLRLITQKIRKTSLLQTNEPLEWNSNDEIGLMVGEYNKMLLNLEQSKKALARSEKESAWREIARQVAHEIKNPLTPMKLTLQHMRRTLGKEPSVASSQQNQIDALIHQIDTLSDIASSFSDFAKMPVPQSEVFELKELLNETIALYENKDSDRLINFHVPDGEFHINADRKYIGQAISNIIINGIQASQDGKKPRIDIYLTAKNNGKCLLSISDNGQGIDEEIREKIFIPNFSTKSSGSGIGLAITKRAVDHAAGDIWFETSAEGTTFFIQLPLIQ